MVEYGIVYGYRNKITNMWYIGQTTNPKDRKYRHKINSQKYIDGTLKNKNHHKFYGAIKEYGFDNFEYIILESDVPKDMLLQREHHYGILYNCLNNGYNDVIGGFGSCDISDDLKSRKSKLVSGTSNPMYGIIGDLNSASVSILELDENGIICRYENADDFKSKNNNPNIRRRAVAFCCLNKNIIYLDKYFICYERDYSPSMLDIIKEYNSVKFIDNNEIFLLNKNNLDVIKSYASIEELSKIIGVPFNIIRKHLLFKTYSVLGNIYVTKFNYNNKSRNEILDLLTPPKRNKRISRDIISGGLVCINHDRYFKTIEDASSFYGLNKSSIMKVLSNNRSGCGKEKFGENLVFKWKKLLK